MSFREKLSRRSLLKAAGAGAALVATGALPGRLLAADPIKVAAIYTVPVEQQWVSRIHKAANAAKERGDIEYVFSENTSNTDYERVMREYCEAGNKLIVGEVFGVEDAARAVAKDYPDVAFLMGSSFKPDAGGAELRGVRQLYPGCLLSHRHHRRRDDQVEEHRHGRRLSDPRSEPADERLHGRREGDGAGRQVPGRLHRLVVRPAQGQGDRLRADRRRRRPALCRALRRLGRGQGEGRAGGRQRHRHAGRLSRDGGRLGAVAFRADARQGDRRGEGRDLQGRRTTASIPS